MDISEEQMTVIQDIMSILGSETSFDIYDKDDISQEVFIICTEILDTYTEDKGELFPFLYGAAKNRLISFCRKYHYNPHTANSKERLLLYQTTDLYETDLIDEDIEFYGYDYDEYIDVNISAELREYYIKWKEGIKVPMKIKNDILDSIKDMIKTLNQSSSK